MPALGKMRPCASKVMRAPYLGPDHGLEKSNAELLMLKLKQWNFLNFYTGMDGKCPHPVQQGPVLKHNGKSGTECKEFPKKFTRIRKHTEQLCHSDSGLPGELQGRKLYEACFNPGEELWKNRLQDVPQSPYHSRACGHTQKSKVSASTRIYRTLNTTIKDHIT